MARISRRAWRDRIVAYLFNAAQQESNSHFYDDYRIACITVAKAAKGEKHPDFWATYEYLGTAPQKVWDMIQADRRKKLGKDYSSWYDEAGNRKPDVPKKSAQSVRLPLEGIAANKNKSGLGS